MSEIAIKEANYTDLLFVAENMRLTDKKEIYAMRWSDDPAMLARDALTVSPGMSWTVGKNVPIAAVGVAPKWPGVWSAWMFATPRFAEVGITMTKFIKKKVIPMIYDHAHRVEAISWSGHSEAHKWLESLGATAENPLREYGKNKEDFITFVWRKQNVRI